VSSLTDTEKRALALADNKIAANAGWDNKLLARETHELVDLLPACDLTMEITGFAPGEIDRLLGDFVDEETDPADETLAPELEPVSQRGDVWALGLHRLMCGDACSAADMTTLVAGQQAALVVADTPYNVKIASIQGRGKIKHREFIQGAGEMSSRQFIRFLNTALSNAAAHSADGSIHFVFMDWRHAGELLAAGNKVYSELKNIVVWVKTNAGQGSFYRSQHELIFVFKNGDAAHLNNVELGKHGRNRSNVWTYAGVNTFRTGRMDELGMHPTVKPIALVADAMRDCSRRGDIVLDPFVGSGTTIMAAERVGRRGYGLEVDPLYVDVAVRRWQAFTKRDALLDGTKQTFDEATADRAAVRSKP
jgi:DNA modification methylase